MKQPALVLLLLFSLSSPAAAFKCTVCHSKNPAMVRMHKALQARDIGCFDCHKVGEKLMGRGASTDIKAQLQRREIDPLCTGCHHKP